MPEVPGMEQIGKASMSMFYNIGAYVDDFLIILLVCAIGFGVYVFFQPY